MNGENHDAIKQYRKRRQERIDKRNGAVRKPHYDSVEEYRKRREKRLEARADAGVGWVYGILKQNGIDTKGMDVKEAFEELAKLNGGEGEKGGKDEKGGESKKKNVNETGSAKKYVNAENSSKAPTVGGYKRKNLKNFKNGYGVTASGEKERNDLKNGLTMNQNTNEKGEWTEEREALHSKIIDDTFEGCKKTDGEHVTTFLGGGPASGKSYVHKTFGKEFGIPEGSVVADPDACKKSLPEYNPDEPWFVHEESSSLAKRITKLSQENGYNTLVDGTGDGSVDGMRKKIKQAKEAGNVVRGRYVFMPVEDAIQLNFARERSVNPEMLVDTHKKISSILPEIAADFDDCELYANIIGGKPKLIAKGGGGKPLEIIDKELYNKFLDNGKYEYNQERVEELRQTEMSQKKKKR